MSSRGPSFLRATSNLLKGHLLLPNITVDENTSFKNPFSASGQGGWNSIENIILGTPGREASAKSMKPADMGPQSEFLDKKVLLSRDYISTSGSPDISCKIRIHHCRKHRKFCQGFPKETPLGTVGRISCCFESLWRAPNSTAGLFNQPCSTEHLSCLHLLPNPSRLFKGEGGSKGTFCQSAPLFSLPPCRGH